MKKPKPDSVPYDVNSLNIDPGPNEIIAALGQTTSARLCFYGPPGTGKTALAKYIGHVTDRPLHIKGASDLLSKWIGETEKNLAEAFERAEEDEAILLIDEVDSFLRSREGATRSWEVTQVNEFLTQLDNFDGIVICTTNHLDYMDHAALRRFDLKIKFDSLRSEEAVKMYRACLGMDADKVTTSEISWIASQDNLTPGDYQAAVRSLRFKKVENPAAALMQALKEELRLKVGSNPFLGLRPNP